MVYFNQAKSPVRIKVKGFASTKSTYYENFDENSLPIPPSRPKYLDTSSNYIEDNSYVRQSPRVLKANYYEIKATSLENLAIEKGFIVPNFQENNQSLQLLREILANKGIARCGGGFCRLWRIFRAIEPHYHKYITRDLFKKIIIESTDGMIQSNQADDIFQCFSSSLNNNGDTIDFELFFISLRVIY